MAYSLPNTVSPQTLLQDLLNISLTAVNLLRPLYDPAGELTDFAPEYFNPAAQRMTGLFTERPTGTARTLFPDIFTNGLFAFYRRIFESGEAGQFAVNYQADRLDNYFRVAAQRSGELLIVSFTDTADQDRSAAELALRESQAAEKAARAEAETQRQRFYDLLMQLPAQVAVHEGPDQVFTLVNPGYQRLAPGRALQGQPIQEAWPELVSQGILDVLDHVYQTGEPFIGKELPFQVDFTRTGQVEQVYFNAFFLPLRDAQGQMRGVLDFSTDVTEQVEARQRVEQLNQQTQAARAEAEAERQRLYQVLMRLPANIALLRGPQHIYELVNSEYERLFPGRNPLGRPLQEVIPELEGQGYCELFDRVYETGEPFYEPESEAWADFAGTGKLQRRYYRTAFEPIRDAQGQVTEVLNFAVDVTAQVEARQQVGQLNQGLEEQVQQRTHEALALQTDLLEAAQSQAAEREAFYQVFEQTPAPVSLLRGPRHRFEYVNAAFQQVFAGRPLVGLDFAQALPDAAAQGYLALLDRVYHTGETYFGNEIPFIVEQPDATRTVYFNFTYQAYRENGQIVGISSFAFDVTEQVLARQQADTAAAELRLLTAHAPAFLFRTDAAGSLVYLNKEFFEWTGLDATRLRSLDEGWAVVHPGDLAEQQPNFVAAVQASQPWLSTPYRFRRADGQYRWMLSRSQPLFGTEGQVLGHSGLTFEVDEQVELQQQLTRTNVDLDNFIYTASHDLKAPITNIEGLLLALEHELPEAGRTGDVSLMLTMMQDAIERFRRTITHLTDISRLQKEYSPDADAVALAPVVEAVRLDLTPLLTQTQGQLTVTIPEGLTVTFAEKNLRSVVYNLLSNAFKYCHPDRLPEVQLRSWLAGDYAVLEVQDNGLGLDLSQGQERLFAMFQRLHTHVEGTGVGLYMVKRILENAGGRIEVSSELGQGTTFRVYFQR